MVDYDNTFETMELVCDICGEIQTFEGGWAECLEEAKTEGWVIIGAGSGYDHFCLDDTESNQSEDT